MKNFRLNSELAREIASKLLDLVDIVAWTRQEKSAKINHIVGNFRIFTQHSGHKNNIHHSLDAYKPKFPVQMRYLFSYLWSPMSSGGSGMYDQSGKLQACLGFWCKSLWSVKLNRFKRAKNFWGIFTTGWLRVGAKVCACFRSLGLAAQEKSCKNRSKLGFHSK